jgi:hypothetical protein
MINCLINDFQNDKSLSEFVRHPYLVHNQDGKNDTRYEIFKV